MSVGVLRTEKRLRVAGGLLVILCFVSPLAAHAASAYSIEPDVVYGHKLGLALTFDVFRPAEANGAGVLFMVSGGWFSRWSDPERTAARFVPLLEEGFTVFAVRHGSAPLFKVPDAVDDVRLAVRFIRHHAGRFGVDAERLGAWGGSAGGHLALMLGTASDEGAPDAADPILSTSNRVAAVVAYFPPVDLRQITGPSERFPALDFAPERSAGVSPLLHVTADDPPSLMIHGDEDTLVPLTHSRNIHAAFTEKEVVSELMVIEGAGHGFRGGAAEEAMMAVVSWFQRHLGDRSADSRITGE